jgi:hypothetical protein
MRKDTSVLVIRPALLLVVFLFALFAASLFTYPVHAQERGGDRDRNRDSSSERRGEESETPPASPTPTATSTPDPTPSPTPTPGDTFKPEQCSDSVDAEIHQTADRYNLPRWHLYALIMTESSCNPNAQNGDDDVGLTQLGGVNYYGRPFPHNLESPNNDYDQWVYDMGINQSWGGGRDSPWVYMTDVTRMTNWFNPRQHLDRYATVYGVPAFDLMQRRYPGRSDNETLRIMAFHWYRGLFTSYNSNEPYLDRYDEYVQEYREPVEDEDGAWNGNPHY